MTSTFVEHLRDVAEATIPGLAGRWDAVDQVWDLGSAPDGRRIAVLPLLYTAAVIIGRPHTVDHYDDRWCYDDVADAVAAATAWDGTGEPTGWHRHPDTGRRREHGDPARETVWM